MANASTLTDSDYDKKYFHSLEENNDDDLGQNPFENDSLSNTVIFVKNSSANNIITQNRQENIDSKTNSSGSSILGIQAYQQRQMEKEIGGENIIGDEVKHLISKIITSIKFSDNFTDDEDEEVDDDEKVNHGKNGAKNHKTKGLNYKYARCDNDYLNEIIEKVLCVLKNSNKYNDYLKLYQNQLSSYLKEALQKYQNQRLVCVLEDILIDISDILCNEFTFYTIVNKNRFIKDDDMIKASKLVENSSMSSLSQCESQNKNETKLNLVKSLARSGGSRKKFAKQCEKNVRF